MGLVSAVQIVHVVSSLNTSAQLRIYNKKAQLTQRERASQQCMYEGPLRTNVKSVKTSILVLKVIQGHCFGVNRNPCMTS